MAKIVLSFDDGRRDNYRVAKEILEPMGIPATFNITTGYIKRDIDEKAKPSSHEPMTEEEVVDLWNNPLFEIAGHGYRHDNDVENLISGINELRKVYHEGGEMLGIASPHSEFDLSILNKNKVTFEQNGIKYLRISNDYTNYGIIKRIVRRLNRILKVPYLYYWTNKDAIMTEQSFLLHSVPIIRDTTLREVKYFIDQVEREDAVCIFMLHSILKPKEDYYNDLFSWDYDKFGSLCAFLSDEAKMNRLDIIKTVDIF